MDNNYLKYKYIKSLVSKLFKILYIKEQQPETLFSYVDSLRIELIGAQQSFDDLQNNPRFQSVINIINYFCVNEDLEHKIIKREVFKCIDLVNKIQAEGGDNGNI